MWVPAAELPMWDSVSAGGETDFSTDTPHSTQARKGQAVGTRAQQAGWGESNIFSLFKQSVRDYALYRDLDQCPEIHIIYINSYHKSLQACVESPGRFRGRCWHPPILIMEALSLETLVCLLHCCFVTLTGLPASAISTLSPGFFTSVLTPAPTISHRLHLKRKLPYILASPRGTSSGPCLQEPEPSNSFLSSLSPYCLLLNPLLSEHGP